MKIPKSLKIEKCVSKDPDRNVLHHVFVEKSSHKKGYACATNGICCVRIPVELDEGDSEGAISIEAIKQARMITSKELEYLEFALNEKVIVKSDSVKSEYERFNHLTFPKTSAVFPKGKVKAFVSLNVRLLKMVADALGTDIVFLEIRESHQAIVIRPNDQSDFKAVLMPCEINRKTGEEKQRDMLED